MSRPLAVFRADAAPQIGLGHVIRCSALAELLDRMGWDCAFALSADSVVKTALSPRWMIQTLPSAESAVEAAALSRHWREGCELLVVDHYGRDRVFESRCRGWAKRILVIDDLGGRLHDCDVLCDPSPDHEPDANADLVSRNCSVLAGLSYAALRPQFAALRPAVLGRRQQTSDAQRLLVSIGGMDATNLTARVLDAAEPLRLDIDVVLGAGAPHLHEIQTRAAANPGIRLHIGIRDMGALMAAADVAVGAGGTTSWERCCLGLPTLVLVAADNQRSGARFLAARDAALVIDDGLQQDTDRIATELARLVADKSLRQALSQRCAALCDGRGGWRTLVRFMAHQNASDGGAVTIRLAESDDAMWMYTLQTAPETRRYSRNVALPSIAEHLSWFEHALADDRRIITVICHRGAPAGVLRFDQRGDAPEFEISIAIAPERHGLGIGFGALNLAQALMPGACLTAEIDPANLASARLFHRAGFRQVRKRCFAWGGRLERSYSQTFSTEESIAS